MTHSTSVPRQSPPPDTEERAVEIGPAPDAEVLIRAAGVSKRFTSYHRRATSLKERLIRREQADSDDFWALRGVKLQVRRGETVGLMGPNGSGKSTLLKVLSGILRPNEGEVEVVGRVASLLELGAGFDGELTGRENVYLNAALLGVPRAETDRMFDDIVAFSELGEFIEFPVKHYSSGMYVRLGFAVAVHVDPDILIVDEVLAVGDAAFQQKCLDRIESFQQQGKTILFVSHSSGLIEQLCTRAVLLSHGEVVFDGRPRTAVTQLNRILGIDQPESTGDDVAQVLDLQVCDPATGAIVETYECGASVVVRASILWPHGLPAQTKVSLNLTSSAQRNPVFEVAPLLHPLSVRDTHNGRSLVEWTIEALPDVPGDFQLNLGVYTGDTLVARALASGIRLQGATRRTIPGTLRLSSG